MNVIGRTIDDGSMPVAVATPAATLTAADLGAGGEVVVSHIKGDCADERSVEQLTGYR